MRRLADRFDLEPDKAAVGKDQLQLRKFGHDRAVFPAVPEALHDVDELLRALAAAGIAAAGVESIEIGGITKTLQGLVFSPLLGFLVATRQALRRSSSR